MAKMYFAWYMRVCVGLRMLAAYFCHSRLSQVEYNCAMIKMDWLEDGIAQRVVGAVLVIFREKASVMKHQVAL